MQLLACYWHAIPGMRWVHATIATCMQAQDLRLFVLVLCDSGAIHVLLLLLLRSILVEVMISGDGLTLSTAQRVPAVPTAQDADRLAVQVQRHLQVRPPPSSDRGTHLYRIAV